MKLLVLTAYPRKNGFTARLLDLFLRGAGEAGAGAEVVDLCAARVAPCKGCYHCWLAEPGRCVISDGMERLLELYASADLLVAATPVYLYGINSEMKKFFERCFPLMRPGIVLTGSGMEHNRIRNPDRGPKAMAGLVTGAMRSMRGFDPAAEQLSLTAEALGMRCAGIIARPETFMLDFAPARPRRIAEVEQAFVRAGAEFARTLKISDKTLKTASARLSGSLKVFRDFANVYWEHAENAGRTGADPGAITKQVLRDMRILIPEMARKSDPSALPREKLKIRFCFPDRNLKCLMVLDKKNAPSVCEDDGTEHPDISITCAAEVWAGIMFREISPARALAEKKIVVKGDVSVFRSFERIFPWNA